MNCGVGGVELELVLELVWEFRREEDWSSVTSCVAPARYFHFQKSGV